MDNIIELQKITKIYGDKQPVQVLFDIDLQIKSGEFCAIIGQSGSGKSTLLNIIGTLDKPSGGTVLVAGNNISNLSQKEIAKLRNKTIGFVFQFHYLLPELSVIDNVMMPKYIAQNKFTHDKARAKELLELVGMGDYTKRMATEVSGGQMQRVAIARSLMNQPSIILADEPTGNLDSVTRESVYQLFRQINKDLGTTIVLITHDATIASNADRVIKISDGRIANG